MILNQVISNGENLLAASVAQDNAIDSILGTAFGTNVATPQAQSLIQQLDTNEFFDNLEFEILPSVELEGALGAYSPANDTIYLSQQFLTQGTVEQATDVLLEEVGHAVDDFLNETDAPGDEGRIFSKLVQGETLTRQNLESLRQENDFNTIEVDGKQLLVEQASFTVDTTVDENDGINTGNISLRDAITEAVNNNQQDTITFDQDLEDDTITLTNGQLNIAESDGLTIDGDIDNDGNPDITVDADEKSRVFLINDNDNSNDVSVTIDGLTIKNGSVGEVENGNGGGILNQEDFTLTNSTVSGNSANSDGGGISNATEGSATIVNSTVRDNTGGDEAGGVYHDNFATTLIIKNSTISGNSANFGGGIRTNEDATITNSTVTGNVVGDNNNTNADGGGVQNDGGTLTISNSTISGNSARDVGGGIDSGGTGTTIIVNSTITNNSSGDYGGGIQNDSSITLRNSIISGNEAANAGNEIYYDNQFGVSFNADANNLFGDSSQTNAQAFENFTPQSNDINATSDNQNIPLNNILEVDQNDDPRLTDNGGSTETIALADGSPAIDAGDNNFLDESQLQVDFNGDGDTNDTLSNDQRGAGFNRVVNNTVDIGAVEVQPAPIPTTPTSSNSPPQANNDSAATEEATTVTINVLANDQDLDNDSLSIAEIDTSDTIGEVSIDENGAVIYNPDNEFSSLEADETRTDSFEYTVSDGPTKDSATVAVTIEGVDSAPVAQDDQPGDGFNANPEAFTTDEDTPLTTPNVLANDRDPEGGSLEIVGFDTGNTTGTVTDNGDGRFTYTPAEQFDELEPGETATDSFSYTVSDGSGQTDTATLTITITGAKEVSARDDIRITNENSAFIIDVLQNDRFGGDGPGNSPLAITEPPENGQAFVNQNNTPNNPADDTISYIPETGYNGQDELSYSITDGSGNESTATVEININSVNQAPTVSDDTFSTKQGTSLTGNVFANDFDADGDSLFVSSVDTTSTLGELSLNNDNGIFTYNSNDAFDSLEPGETAADQFSYTASDGNGGTAQASVTITVTGSEDSTTATITKNSLIEQSPMVNNSLPMDII